MKQIIHARLNFRSFILIDGALFLSMRKNNKQRARERGGDELAHKHTENIFLCNQNHMNDDAQSISKTLPIICCGVFSTSTKLEIEIAE